MRNRLGTGGGVLVPCGWMTPWLVGPGWVGLVTAEQFQLGFVHQGILLKDYCLKNYAKEIYQRDFLDIRTTSFAQVGPEVLLGK